MIIFGLHVETNRKLINLRVISTTYYLYKTSSRITRLSNNIPCFHFKQYTLFSLQTIYPVFTSNITFFSKSLSTFKKSILQIIRPSPSSTYNCDIITRELNTLPDYVLDYVLIQCAVAEWILTQLVIVYSIASIFQMTDLLTWTLLQK